MTFRPEAGNAGNPHRNSWGNMTAVFEPSALQARSDSWEGRLFQRQEWIDKMSERGCNCQFSPRYPGRTRAMFGQAAQMLTSNVEQGWQSHSVDRKRMEAWADRSIRLMVIRSGQLTVEEKHQTVSLGAGDMALFDLSRACVKSSEEPSQYSVFHIEKSLLSERGIRCRFSSACNPVQQNPEVAAVRELLLTFAGHIGCADNSLLGRIGSQLVDLMDVVVGNSDASRSIRTPEGTVLRAKQLIARRFGNPALNLTEIADELNISATSLMRAFRRHGVTPMRYVYSVRLKHAAQMLENLSGVTIQEVGALCGFTNAAHFSRAFKEQYDLAPREYVEHHRLLEKGAHTTGDAAI